jgi:hypothetical protein
MSAEETPRVVLARLVRRVLGIGLLLYLVDLNSTHVRDFVVALVRSWRDAETQHEMSAIGAALEAEYATMRRYPRPDDLPEFIRQWLPATKGRDPSLDRWGSPFRLELEGASYVLRSCGPDLTCGNEDDLERRGSELPPPR